MYISIVILAASLVSYSKAALWYILTIHITWLRRAVYFKIFAIAAINGIFNELENLKISYLF